MKRLFPYAIAISILMSVSGAEAAKKVVKIPAEFWDGITVTTGNLVVVDGQFVGDGGGLTGVVASVTAGVNQVTFDGTNYLGDLIFIGSGIAAEGQTFTFNFALQSDYAASSQLLDNVATTQNVMRVDVDGIQANTNNYARKDLANTFAEIQAFVKGITVGTASSTAAWIGALAAGQEVSSGDINAINQGAQASGYSSGADSLIQADGPGAVARGYAIDKGRVWSMASGSVAMGLADANGVTGNGDIAAEDEGCFAYGYALGFSIEAKGNGGATAGGFANTGDVTADGNGAYAHGDNCQATANYTRAIGQGAEAAHANSYVWSDGTATTSTATKVYVIMAGNGCWINGMWVQGDGTIQIPDQLGSGDFASITFEGTNIVYRRTGSTNEVHRPIP